MFDTTSMYAPHHPLARALLDLFCKYPLELPERSQVCAHWAQMQIGIPLRDGHQAACGYGNHFCLPSPCSTVGLEQFVLSVAILCTV